METCQAQKEISFFSELKFSTGNIANAVSDENENNKIDNLD